MNKNKILKLFTILLLVISLSGCTKVLKNGKEAVTNPNTGQSITENILCRPTDETLKKIYEDNKVDIEKLPECKNMKVTGVKYDGLWTTFFVQPLAYLIVKLGTLIKSNALSIIVITLLIRLILFPLTKKTAMHSEYMKKAHPELARLEKKYENKQDQQSLAQKSQEMLMIYKKYNINPMSGCLFSFIQLPLLFAFLEAINRVPAIFEEKFLGLEMGKTAISGLTHGQYYYIIIVIIILLTTYFSFKLNSTGQATKEMQRQTNMMMIFMIVLIGITSFTLPTAIGVYWITSSLFTIIQNLITDKSLRKGSSKNA